MKGLDPRNPNAQYYKFLLKHTVRPTIERLPTREEVNAEAERKRDEPLGMRNGRRRSP